MAHLIPNTFSSYQLTDLEELQGQILTVNQKQVIQNRLSIVAEEKLLLVFDPEHAKHFIQQEASLAGQIAALSYILELSDASEQLMNDPNQTIEE